MAKKLLQSSIYLIALTIVSIVGAILINAALAAYVGPTANPPSSNLTALLSSGTDASLLTLTLTGTTLTLSQTTNARFYANASKGFQVRLDSDNNDANAEFAINNGANAEVFKVDESGNVTATGGIRLGNYATKPACSAGILGSMVFDTANDKPYVCGAGSIWKPLDSDYDKDGIVDWNDQDDTDATKKTATLIPENIKSGVTIFGVTGTMAAMSPPSTPTNFAVSTGQTVSGLITVSWSSPGSYPLDGYKVYRNGTLVATLGLGTTSYAHSGLSNGVAYSFAVSAYNNIGESTLTAALNGIINTCYIDWDSDGYGDTNFSGYGVNGCYQQASIYNTDCWNGQINGMCNTEASAYHPGAPYRSSLPGTYCMPSNQWDFDCSGGVSKMDHTGKFINAQSGVNYCSNMGGGCACSTWLPVSSTPWSSSSVACGDAYYYRNGPYVPNCAAGYGSGYWSLAECQSCSNPMGPNEAQVISSGNQECRQNQRD